MIYGFILCLGDSITNGARDEYNRAYPFELSDMLSNKFEQQWICINKGVNNWTSADLLRNAYDLTKRYPEAVEVVVCIGTNDSKPSVQTPPLIFQKNMRGILRALNVLGRIVYLCSVPDFGRFGSTGYDMQSLTLIKEYNAILANLASGTGNFVDLSNFPKDCYPDSVHLNNKGSKEMARRVMDAIIRRRGFGVEDITKERLGEEHCRSGRYEAGNNKVFSGGTFPRD